MMIDPAVGFGRRMGSRLTTMGRIIAIANQKGGVGKTTTAVNTAAALAAMRRRVLLIDLDPQGNATTGSGIDKQEIERSTLEALMGEIALADCIQTAGVPGYDVLPSNSDLTAAEVRLLEAPLRERRLAMALEPVIDAYDYILPAVTQHAHAQRAGRSRQRTGAAAD
jgi:chromosome partitioning protein